MIAWLKILTTFIPVLLGIIAILYDMRKDGEDGKKKIKPVGYLYVALFGAVSFFNYFLEKWESDQESEETRKNFSSLIRHTDSLLKATETNLDFQFERIKGVNNQIDKKLSMATDSIQSQLEQSSGNLEEIENLSVKTISNIETAISSLDGMGKTQKESITQLKNVSDKSQENLTSINKVFDQINSLTYPLIPLQFIFRVSYKLKEPPFRPEQIRQHLATHGDMMEWAYVCYWKPTDNFYRSRHNHTDELINSQTIGEDFFNNSKISFSFFGDSGLSKNVLNYCSIAGDCGQRDDMIYYRISDTSLVRHIVITSERLTSNLSQIGSLKELVTGNFIQAKFYQFGEDSHRLVFRYKGSDGNYHKYKKELVFSSISLEPVFKIRYGTNFTLTTSIQKENVLRLREQQKAQISSDSDWSVLVMKLSE